MKLFHVKHMFIACTLVISMNVHAAGMAHGGIGAAAHGGNSSSHGQSAQGQSGQGNTGERDMAHYVLCEQPVKQGEK